MQRASLALLGPLHHSNPCNRVKSSKDLLRAELFVSACLGRTRFAT